MKLFTKIIYVLKKCNNILYSIVSVLRHVVSLIRSRTHFKTKVDALPTVSKLSKRKEEIMITANQVAYWSLQEQIRSNQAREEETKRSNIAKENQAAVEAKETHRANIAKETETKRHNINNEILDFSDKSPLAMGVAASLQAGKGLFADPNTTQTSSSDENYTNQTSDGGGRHGGRAGRKEKR